MTEAFNEIWLDGEKAATVEYWQHDIAKFDLDKVRHPTPLISHP
jgi:sulfite reductase (ferredoxin)